MRDRVGVGMLGHDPQLVARQRVQRAGVIPFQPDHIGFVQLECLHFQTCHHFHAPRFAPVRPDQRAGVIGFKGVGHAQGHIGTAQDTRGVGVDRFHAKVRQLVSHVIAGASDLDGIFHTHDLGVRAGQVEFLVDQRLSRAGQGGQMGKDHFGITPIIFAHQPFGAMGIAGHDGHFGAQVRADHGLFQPRSERGVFSIAPARQIHKPRIDHVALQQQGQHKGRMRFAQPRQQFAHNVHLLRNAEMSVAAQALQIQQTGARPFHPVTHKGIGLLAVGGMGQDFGVDRAHPLCGRTQTVLPARATIVRGKTGINPGRAGFLVFQQHVGHPAKGRNDKDTVIQRIGFAVAQKQCLDQLWRATH